MTEAIHIVAHSLSIAMLVAMLLVDAIACRAILVSYKATRRINQPLVAILACCTSVQFVNVFIIQRL